MVHVPLTVLALCSVNRILTGLLVDDQPLFFALCKALTKIDAVLSKVNS